MIKLLNNNDKCQSPEGQCHNAVRRSWPKQQCV